MNTAPNNLFEQDPRLAATFRSIFGAASAPTAPHAAPAPKADAADAPTDK
jgi:hypothetical protein